MREVGPDYLLAGDGYRVRAAATNVVIISLPGCQVGFESEVGEAGNRNWRTGGEWPGVAAILRDSARVGAGATRGNTRPTYRIPGVSFPVRANAYRVSAWHIFILDPLELPRRQL